MSVCSCCGHPTAEAGAPFSVDLKTNTLKIGGASVRVRPHEAEIAEALVEGHPGPVSRNTLGHILYGRTTRPVEWEMGVRVRVTNLRKVISGHGLGIECIRKRGYRVVTL